MLYCAGVRAGAKVQATEVPVRPRERAPRQSHSPNAYTGKVSKYQMHLACFILITDCGYVMWDTRINFLPLFSSDSESFLSGDAL